jgi:hypothetical protein
MTGRDNFFQLVTVLPPSDPFLTNSSLLGLLRAVFTPASRSVRNTALEKKHQLAFPTFVPNHQTKHDGSTYQIQRPSNKMIPHTRAILRPAPPNKHNTMLLDIVPLAGDIRGDMRPRAQLHTRNLALPRIWLLGPHHTHAQTHALHGWCVR